MGSNMMVMGLYTCIVIVIVLLYIQIVTTQSNDGLDLSKVLDTLYDKVEKNMIKTIKKNLGGKNSLIKPQEKVDCGKRTFGLNPKCIRSMLTRRMRKVENSVKVLAVKNNNLNILQTAFNKHRKRVNEFIINQTR